MGQGFVIMTLTPFLNQETPSYEHSVGWLIMYSGRSHAVGPSGSNIGEQDCTNHQAAQYLHQRCWFNSCHIYAQPQMQPCITSVFTYNTSHKPTYLEKLGDGAQVDCWCSQGTLWLTFLTARLTTVYLNSRLRCILMYLSKITWVFMRMII